jgi:hypothetical protein
MPCKMVQEQRLGRIFEANEIARIFVALAMAT